MLCYVMTTVNRLHVRESKTVLDSKSKSPDTRFQIPSDTGSRQLELGKLMFSLNHSLLPSKFNNYFSLNKQVHSYMPLDSRTIFTFLFVEQTFVNFLSVSKDLLIITL